MTTCTWTSNLGRRHSFVANGRSFGPGQNGFRTSALCERYMFECLYRMKTPCHHTSDFTALLVPFASVPIAFKVSQSTYPTNCSNLNSFPTMFGASCRLFLPSPLQFCPAFVWISFAVSGRVHLGCKVFCRSISGSRVLGFELVAFQKLKDGFFGVSGGFYVGFDLGFRLQFLWSFIRGVCGSFLDTEGFMSVFPKISLKVFRVSFPVSVPFSFRFPPGFIYGFVHAFRRVSPRMLYAFITVSLGLH